MRRPEYYRPNNKAIDTWYGSRLAKKGRGGMMINRSRPNLGVTEICRDIILETLDMLANPE